MVRPFIDSNRTHSKNILNEFEGVIALCLIENFLKDSTPQELTKPEF